MCSYEDALFSAASLAAFITFSSVSALARSPDIFTCPVMNAEAGESSPKWKLRYSIIVSPHVNELLRLKIFMKFVSFILKVTSAFEVGSPCPTAPSPFLKSRWYLPSPSI